MNLQQPLFPTGDDPRDPRSVREIQIPPQFMSTVRALEEASGKGMWQHKFEELLAFYLCEPAVYLADCSRSLREAHDPLRSLVWKANQRGYKDARVYHRFVVKGVRDA